MARSRKSKSGDPKVAIGYLRLSPGDRKSAGPNGNADAVGLDVQRAGIEAWAKANDVMIAAWFEDVDVSGGDALEKRPALMAAIDALLEHKAGVMIFAKRDRIARDVVLCAMVERLIERQGAVVISADGMGNGSGPEAEMMKNLLNVFAQYERAIIRSRTKAALAQRKAAGGRTGMIPYGYQLTEAGSKQLTELPSEQATLARIKELRAIGAKTGKPIGSRRMVRILTAEGFPHRGGCWHQTTVEVLIRRIEGTPAFA